MDKRYKRVLRKYKYRLFNLNHVVGVGYGIKEKNGEKTGDEAIIVLVDRKMPLQSLSEMDLVPLTIAGCQTDVLEVGKMQLLNRRTEKIRPARPGVSVGHYQISAGTLGAVVKDKKSGAPMILSNNHVLANATNGRDEKAEIGDPILQPGTYDDGSKPDDIIGHLERFVPINGDREESGCPVARDLERLGNELLQPIKPDYRLKLFKRGVENKVDCALAKPVSGDAVKNDILGIGRVRGVREPEVGLTVQKSGRTTGVTGGTIKAIDTTVQVEMSHHEKAIFEDQFITEKAISKAGDSGSLILDEKNKAVGLLFAGSDKATAGNRIRNVMDELQITF